MLMTHRSSIAKGLACTITWIGLKAVFSVRCRKHTAPPARHLGYANCFIERPVAYAHLG